MVSHKLSVLSLLVSLSVSTWSKIIYAGVNESGGEFASQNLPGQFGVDYAFINKTAVDIFTDQEQINLFRVTFLMERMCPLETGLGSTFNETYFSEFADAVNYITTEKGAYAILDPHNYMRYNDPSMQPFSGSPTQLVLDNNQAAVDGIRSTGAEQLILAPGNSWTGGHSWTQAAPNEPSSEFLNKLVDPLNNTAIDIHEYLGIIVPSRLNGSLITLAIQMKTFPEDTPNALNLALDDLLTYLADNDVWIGWTAWAAGPFWGTFSPCCGSDTGSLEPGLLNALGEPNAFDSVWTPAIKPHVPVDDLKRNGTSSLQ
ncbi:hypothetical protein VNI00_014576 [Paramarasmius palmivorus]|uniref:cellulase n=1 Tax=Paramarasmius palmivorus TaxID=297713 RepID=A0AAW0BRZ2_9AGAR